MKFVHFDIFGLNLKYQIRLIFKQTFWKLLFQIQTSLFILLLLVKLLIIKHLSFLFLLSNKSRITLQPYKLLLLKKNQAKKFASLLKTSANFNKPQPFIRYSSAQARDFQRKRNQFNQLWFQGSQVQN